MERIILPTLNNDFLIPASFKVPDRLPRRRGSDIVCVGDENVLRAFDATQRARCAVLDPAVLSGNEGRRIPAVLKLAGLMGYDVALGRRTDELEMRKQSLHVSYIFGVKKLGELRDYVSGYQELVLARPGGDPELLELGADVCTLRYSRKALRAAKDLGCALDLLGHLRLDDDASLTWTRKDGSTMLVNVGCSTD